MTALVTVSGVREELRGTAVKAVNKQFPSFEQGELTPPMKVLENHRAPVSGAKEVDGEIGR